MRVAKQVIVMRKDLNMRKGKMIAQGAHASLKVFLDRRIGGAGADPVAATATAPVADAAAEPAAAVGDAFTFAVTAPMAAWLGGRFTKVCVSVGSAAELDDVVARARAAGVPCALIVDAGHTEFHGVPTSTCCAVGPAWAEDVDAITGALPLL